MHIDFNKYELKKANFYSKRHDERIEIRKKDSSELFKCLKCGKIISSIVCKNCDHDDLDFYCSYVSDGYYLKIDRVDVKCNNCSKIYQYWTCKCGCENNFLDCTFRLVDIEKENARIRAYEDEREAEAKRIELNHNITMYIGLTITGLVILFLFLGIRGCYQVMAE